ncbi:MAG TPA: hypothetical protein VHO50_12350 [Bacteroidales bacterium]|nr:hypothetical protein [Bacteroidales bacterium]
MKRYSEVSKLQCLLLLLVCFSLESCFKEDKEKPLFVFGEFPDTVLNLEDLNSQYDDYNVNVLGGDAPVIFSTNRESAGGQFDLEQGGISFSYDQAKKTFDFQASITNDQMLDRLISNIKTQGDDFGPYRFFSSADGYEYMVVASVNNNGNLDLRYQRNMPRYGTSLPAVEGPFQVNIINTTSNDGYLCFDTNQDSAYFCSDRAGDFNIFLITRPSNKKVNDWFDQGSATAVMPDNLNSNSNDKCPNILRNIMVFTSDRPGGLGGYDLYYSVLKNGAWSTPVNFGPSVNSENDEYRPFLGYHPQFSNMMLIFSSNRPGGKGGFDLYFTGFNVGK